MSDFNQILQQKCKIWQQANRQISVKSVDDCNSYSKFSDVTLKHGLGGWGKEWVAGGWLGKQNG